MTSRTRSSPNSRVMLRVALLGTVAVETMNQPRSAVQSVTNGMSTNVPGDPGADQPEAERPCRPGSRRSRPGAGRRGSPTAAPARIRPPSSGAAGIRLKTASTTLTNASQPIAETTSDETTPLAAPATASRRNPTPSADARGRSGGRDPQLRAGRRHRTAELRDATEQPEGDALDLHAVAPGDDRVRELVGEQRGEEEDDGDDRDDPELRRRSPRRSARTRAAPAMTSTDQWTPDLDAEDPTEPDAGLHHDSLRVPGRRHALFRCNATTPARRSRRRPENPAGMKPAGWGVDWWWSLPHASGRPLTRGCVASISMFESGEASRRCRSVVKESAH